MTTPTHLDYPELGYPTRYSEGVASNAAWDAIAAAIGTDNIADTAIFDFPTELTKISETEYTVVCRIAGNNPPTEVVQILLNSWGWGAL